MKLKTMLLMIVISLILVGCSCEPSTTTTSTSTTTTTIVPDEFEFKLVSAESQDTLPITTWQEMEALAIVKFDSDLIACDNWHLDRTPPVGWEEDLPVDEFGYYGFPVTTLREEFTGFGSSEYTETVATGNMTEEDVENCRPITMFTVLELDVDPNNGWISAFSCNFDECSDSENYRFQSSDNPDFETYTMLDSPHLIKGYSFTFECRAITEWICKPR